MKPTILIATTVHWPDDTRIRERLIRTLSPEFHVVYAARSPGPTDTQGLDYLELTGGRLARNWRAIRVALGSRWDVLVVHDPELIVCAMLARMRRRPVVFDVHEDIPASAYTRAWVPRAARRPISILMRALLRIVEPALVITLAEAGYQRLFARPHPTFPNHPDTTSYPEAHASSAHGPVIYLGDVTFERGADVAVAACSSLGTPLHLVGRVTPEARAMLQMGSTLGDDLTFAGLVPNREALDIVARSSVGLAPLRDLPNYRHSQPTKILEYLAVGIPVVASDLPGTRELVEGLDAVVLVDPGDVDALAAGIAKARAPEVAGLARSQAGSIRARFRWPAEQVRDFYRSLT